MIAYKITTTELQSATVSATASAISVQYKVGEWVEPPIANSGLFVFKELVHAQNYREGDTNLMIWLCEVPALQQLDFRAICTDADTIKSYWSGDIGKEVQYMTPTGTHIAPKVKLIREIKCK